jgi:hypothetical protein
MTKRSIFKRITVFLSAALAGVLLFSGCLSGINQQTGDEHWEQLFYKIKSSRTEFAADNVSLDFYYGTTYRYPYWYRDPSGEFQFHCFALYFYDGQYYNNRNLWIDDYHNVDKYHFIKEISGDEFTSVKYNVKRNSLFGNNFSHHEKLIIPQTVFERERGAVVFNIAYVMYSQTSQSYHVQLLSTYIALGYSYMNDQTIRLSEFSNMIVPY